MAESIAWERRGLVMVATVAEVQPAPRFCGTERGYQSHRYLFRKYGVGVWPLPEDDPCGCRAGHAAHEWFRVQMQRREREEVA